LPVLPLWRERYRSAVAVATASTTGRVLLTLTTTRPRSVGLTAISDTSLGHRWSLESSCWVELSIRGLEWTLQSTVWITCVHEQHFDDIVKIASHLLLAETRSAG